MADLSTTDLAASGGLLVPDQGNAFVRRRNFNTAFLIPYLDQGDFFARDPGCATRCKGEHVTPEARETIKSLVALEIAVRRAKMFDLSDFLAKTNELIADGGETPAGDWIEFELSLSSFLSSGFWTRAKDLLLKPFRSIFDKETFDEGAFQEAVQTGDAAMREKLAELEPGVRKIVDQTLDFAESRVSPGILDHLPNIAETVDNLTSSTMHYVDDFFTAHVVPALQREIDETLSEGALARPNLGPIFETLNERLSGDSYWQIVANATASRSFHYGYLKAGAAQGFQKVVFSAVMDDHTSVICADLNGSTYQLADMLAVYERSTAAQSTDELKSIAPWYAPKPGLTNAENIREYLAQVGVPTPPLHGRCRSTLLLM